MKFIIKKEDCSELEVGLSLQVFPDRVILNASCNGSLVAVMAFEDGKYSRVKNAHIEGLVTDSEGRILEVED